LRNVLVKLLGFGALLGLLAFGITLIAGTQMLSLFYSPEYASYAHVMTWLMASAGVTGLASLLNYAITSAKCFKAQVPLFALVAGTNALACSQLVPSSGLIGASMASLAASLVHLSLAAGLAYYLLSPGSKRILVHES